MVIDASTASVAGLLDTLSLAHLHGALDSESLESWKALSRVQLLAHLKMLGVAKLSDRQAVANGFSKAQRLAASCAAAAPSAAVAESSLPRRGKKGKILCLHGGASSGKIMRLQLAQFVRVMGDDYDFCFADGPKAAHLDPASPQARILKQFFDGLPVLRWMDIVDKATGKSTDLLGGAVTPTARRLDKRTGRMVSLIDAIDKLEMTNGNGANDGANAASAEVAMAGSEISSSEAVKAGSPFGDTAAALDARHHTYAEAGLAMRQLAAYVAQHGPFDGAIGFSQGANTLALWLSLIEAGVVDPKRAAPQWACLICATNWGWPADMDGKAEALARAIGPALGARSTEEVTRLATSGSLPCDYGQPSGVPPRLAQLMSSGPLGIPSMHLIGEHDPARAFSEATALMYADAPTVTTASIFRSRMPTMADGPLRVVVRHPNDHMPPKQKDIVQAVAAFAERFSPREPDVALAVSRE